MVYVGALYHKSKELFEFASWGNVVMGFREQRMMKMARFILLDVLRSSAWRTLRSGHASVRLLPLALPHISTTTRHPIKSRWLQTSQHLASFP